MNLTPAKESRLPILWNVAAVSCLCLSMSLPSPAQTTSGNAGAGTSTAPTHARGFSTPQQAAEVEHVAPQLAVAVGAAVAAF